MATALFHVHADLRHKENDEAQYKSKNGYGIHLTPKSSLCDVNQKGVTAGGGKISAKLRYKVRRNSL